MKLPQFLIWMANSDSDKFEISISVPLILEYEDILRRQSNILNLSSSEIDEILNYICAIGRKRKIFFLYRPHLPDANDDFIFELALVSNCDYIITYNINDFKGIEKFGIQAITQKEFLKLIGVL